MFIIRETLKIPVYGMGGRWATNKDAKAIQQVRAFAQHFVKKYVNLADVITNEFQELIEEKGARSFPTEEHTYKMPEEKL